MRSVVKYIVGKTYKPLLVKYLSKTRMYYHKGISLEVPPQVFHPQFFFSTKLLLNYIEELELHAKSFLELGAGSGLISIAAAKKGAKVTASDINPIAIKTLFKNRLLNKADFDILHSDMFEKIPVQPFDFIAINPPYYKKKPQVVEDYAWYCGEEGEYFSRLFQGLKDYTSSSSVVLMILCDGCDMDMITSMAMQSSIEMNPVLIKRNLLEENIIYQLVFK